MVLAPVVLTAALPLVIGAPQSRPVVADGRLGGQAALLSLADLLRSAARDPGAGVEPARRPAITCARRTLLGKGEPSGTHIPHGIRGPGVRQVAESDRWHGGALVQRRIERLHRRRDLGIDPVLVVNALHELPSRRQPPRELREDLVLLVGSRKIRVGARLTVVVAQILVSGEEPQRVPHDRSTEVGREVAVAVALVAARLLAGARNEKEDRLAGEARPAGGGRRAGG